MTIRIYRTNRENSNRKNSNRKNSKRKSMKRKSMKRKSMRSNYNMRGGDPCKGQKYGEETLDCLKSKSILTHKQRSRFSILNQNNPTPASAAAPDAQLLLAGTHDVFWPSSLLEDQADFRAKLREENPELYEKLFSKSSAAADQKPQPRSD